MKEHHEELAALHALGLLEGTEQSAFEAELAGNPELRRLTAEFAETTSLLALAAPDLPPPAGLRARLLESTSFRTVESAAGVPATGEVSAPASVYPLGRLVPWAAAAAVALVAGWLLVQNTGLRRENNSLRTEVELAETAYQMSQGQLRERTLVAERMINELGNRLWRQEDLSRLKITALAALARDATEAEAIAVWDPDLETGLLTVDKLPAIAESQDYQIWIIDPTYPIPVDGGVFRPGENGKASLTFKGDKPIKTVNAFAISLEKKGGVPKAEGPIVLLGK